MRIVEITNPYTGLVIAAATVYKGCRITGYTKEEVEEKIRKLDETSE